MQAVLTHRNWNLLVFRTWDLKVGLSRIRSLVSHGLWILDGLPGNWILK